MELPPELEFHEDIHLLIYRPHGVIGEAAVKKVVSALEDLEARLEKPFNRFSDTLAADEVELNFKYVIQVSLCRRLSYAGHAPVKSAILAADSGNDSLRAVACLADSRLADQRAHLSGSRRSREVARGTARTANNASPDDTRRLNRSICCLRVRSL